MIREGRGTKTKMGAFCLCAAMAACSYDFDGLIAPPAGGSAGSLGTSGAAGITGGASGSAGQGEAGQPAGGGGRGGAGAGGAAGAPIDGSPGTSDAPDGNSTTIDDVRSDGAFDCMTLGGTIYQSHCYYPSIAVTNWDTAKNGACAAPSHLAVITTAGEQSIVAAILAGKDRWIGLRKDSGPPNNEQAFKWVTGEQLNHRAWETYDAGAPEPNYTGDCVRMRATANWADTPCTESHAAVCERE